MDKQLQILHHNLEAAAQYIMESCEASDHFRDATKMIVYGECEVRA